MILLCGIPSEPPLAMVREELARLSVPTLLFNQREFAQWGIELSIAAGRAVGWVTVDGRRLRLEDVRGVFLRLMDDRHLPELQDEPPDSPRRRYCRGVHDALMRWCEVTSARVVNRLAPMGSNSSKPYQLQLIRELGFAVPETLITSDPDAVLEFRRTHGRVVYKSISGVRSIVHTLEDADLQRLHLIRWCPTQFQAYVEGHDVRVHVVDTAVFATRIDSGATDYRYAQRQINRSAELAPTELAPEAAAACVKLARGLGLAFAGIDLRVSADGRVTCFEVNPCPAFSYYESHTGQPIAAAVARYLARGAGRHT